MSSAATATTTHAERQSSARGRHSRPAVTRRAGLQLLAGLLIVAGIPVIATVRILDASALRNERAHADAALQVQLQTSADELRGLADDGSGRAEDLSNSRALQRAFLTNDRATVARIARKERGLVFYLRGRRVAGRVPKVALTRPVSLALDGKQVGQVVAAIALDRRLTAHLLSSSPQAPSDRLLIVRGGVVLPSGEPVHVNGRSVRVGGQRYRGILASIPNAHGTSLLAIRPEPAISAAAGPYQRRVLYAAIGSFSLLVLVGLLFGGPILSTLGDFRRIASQAATDSLTGLANRWTFDEELALEWRRAERVGDPLALILADIDDFKAVNDGYGHQVGDEVLRIVGRVFSENVRQIDLAARYGGEEFAVIAPETDLDGAVQLAERIRAALATEQVELPNGGHVAVTASLGVAVKSDLPDAEELVAAADEALYEAKRAGKNRVAPEPARSADGQPSPRPAERRRRRPSSKR